MYRRRFAAYSRANGGVTSPRPSMPLQDVTEAGKHHFRVMPNRCIRDNNVVRLIPRRPAAPREPETFQLAFSSAARIL